MAQSAWVCLEVGGRRFKISKATVYKRPQSTLAVLLQAADSLSPATRGEAYIFDRNADHFSVLVDYMRLGQVFLGPTMSVEQFQVEADFWGLPEAGKAALTQTLKRKNQEEYEASRAKKAKMQPKSLAEIQAELAELQLSLTKLIASQVPTQLDAPAKTIVALLLGFDVSERREIIEKVKTLEGRVVKSMTDKPTHLIVAYFQRTPKVLVAINKGLEILSQDWVDSSVKAGHWLPAQDYYACAPEQERRLKFSYSEALQKARERPFLVNYEFYLPDSLDLTEVVTSAGGSILKALPAAPAARSYVVYEVFSQEAKDLLDGGFRVRDTKWLKNCVLRQEVI